MEKKTIDTRGLFCPGPLQVLKGVVKQLPPGSTLEIISDDADSKEQIAKWCEETGNPLQSIQEKNGDITFTIVLK
ncbi:MAG: sulfurtransferase TusA family protein [Candidatus Bathyarchaeia archaeon]